MSETLRHTEEKVFEEAIQSALLEAERDAQVTDAVILVINKEEQSNGFTAYQADVRDPKKFKAAVDDPVIQTIYQAMRPNRLTASGMTNRINALTSHAQLIDIDTQTKLQVTYTNNALDDSGELIEGIRLIDEEGNITTPYTMLELGQEARLAITIAQHRRS